MVKKRGEPDLTGAARLVLRDWSTGKVPWYTMPPREEGDAAATPLTGILTTADEAILGTLRTRKEMRKAEGLVLLSSGNVDEREVILDEKWWGMNDEPLGEDEEEEWAGVGEDTREVEQEGDGEDDDEESDGDDAEGGQEEEDEVVESEGSEAEGGAGSDQDLWPPRSSLKKRKRASSSAALTPSTKKKLTFAPDPPESKKARRAASRGKPAAAATNGKVNSSAAAHTTKNGRKVNVKNVPKAKGKAAAAVAKDGEETYDFGKFFR